MQHPKRFVYAKCISVATQAPFLVAILLLFIALADQTQETVLSATLSFTFISLLPFLIIVAFGKHANSSYEIYDSKSRTILYVLSIILYLLNAALLVWFDASVICLFITACYLIGISGLLALNCFTKVSVHAAGIAIFISLCLCIFGTWGIITAPLLPIVIWARHVAGKHTMLQLLLGSAVGILIPVIICLLCYKFYIF